MNDTQKSKMSYKEKSLYGNAGFATLGIAAAQVHNSKWNIVRLAKSLHRRVESGVLERGEAYAKLDKFNMRAQIAKHVKKPLMISGGVSLLMGGAATYHRKRSDARLNNGQENT